MLLDQRRCRRCPGRHQAGLGSCKFCREDKDRRSETRSGFLPPSQPLARPIGVFAVRRYQHDGLVHSQRCRDGAYRPLKDVGDVGVSGDGLLEIGEQCERLPLLCEFVAEAGHRIVEPENLAAELVYVTTVVLDFASKGLMLVSGGFGHGKVVTR